MTFGGRFAGNIATSTIVFQWEQHSSFHPPSLFLPAKQPEALLKTNFSRPNVVSPILVFKYSNSTVLVQFLWKPFMQQWWLRQHALFFSAFALIAFSQTQLRTGSIYKQTPQTHQNRHILTISAKPRSEALQWLLESDHLSP